MSATMPTLRSPEPRPPERPGTRSRSKASRSANQNKLSKSSEVSSFSEESKTNSDAGKVVTNSKSDPRPPNKVRKSAETPSSIKTQAVGQNVAQIQITPSSQGDENNQPQKSEGLAVKGVGKLDDEVFKPFGPPSRSSSVADNAEDPHTQCHGGLSGTCGRPVTDEDDGILCDACFSWYHAECQGFPSLR